MPTSNYYVFFLSGLAVVFIVLLSLYKAVYTGRDETHIIEKRPKVIRIGLLASSLNNRNLDQGFHIKEMFLMNFINNTFYDDVVFQVSTHYCEPRHQRKCRECNFYVAPMLSLSTILSIYLS